MAKRDKYELGGRLYYHNVYGQDTYGQCNGVSPAVKVKATTRAKLGELVNLLTKKAKDNIGKMLALYTRQADHS
jgi:hypothetical protein